MKLPFSPFLGVQFSGLKCLHGLCDQSLELFHLVKQKLCTHETTVLLSPFPPVAGNHPLIFCPRLCSGRQRVSILPPLSSAPPVLPIQLRTCFVSFTSEPRVIHKLCFLSYIYIFYFVQIYNCLILVIFSVCLLLIFPLNLVASY